jgi:N4-gp56 family major capsid protein
MAVTYDGQQIPGPVITGTSSGAPGNADLASIVVKQTFDKVIAFKAWTEPTLRRFATVQPVDIAHPGSSIDMFIQTSDLALATTPLAEYADPDFVALPTPEKRTLTLNEYGNAAVTTLRLRDFSWAQIDPFQAELIERNQRLTLDKLVENVIMGAPNKYNVDKTGTFGKGAADPANAGTIKSGALRRIVAQMRSQNALEWDGGNYVALIHPDVAVDLREETDPAGWRFPHVYTENTNGPIFTAEVGQYEGIRFIEYNRAPKSTDANPIYTTIIMGREGLAEATAVPVSTVVTPQLDKFGRMLGVGWYFFGGWGLYRHEAISLLQTGSSLSAIQSKK